MKNVRILTIGALLAGSTAFMANEASAQFFPRPHVYGGFYSGPVFLPPAYLPPVPRRPVGLGASEIFEDLYDQGFTGLSVVSRRADVFVINATDRRNQQVRLVVDAFDGEILERFARQGEIAHGATALGTDLRKKEQTRSARGEATRNETTAGETPTPPRRPSVAAITPSAPMPALRPTPVAPARSPSDWAPINSIPVAPLD